MKYALFEFVTERSCEIGETRWITREDPQTFDNSQWDWEKEVMVSWPLEFSKINKKIMKNSIDPKSLPTTTCVAKVIQFSDDYETIRLHMVRYIETGSVKTPSHGRGKRTTRPNGRYANSDEEELDNETSQQSHQASQEKPPKRTRKNGGRSVVGVEQPNVNEMEVLKAKYNLDKKRVSDESDHEHEDILSSITDEEDIASLKQENQDLQRKLNVKEREVQHLHGVIRNLKAMPCLPSIVQELQKQVELLTQGQKYSVPASEPCTPSRPSSSSSQRSSSDSDAESEMVSLCPNVTLTKGQHSVIKSKSTVKDFVYSIMGMIWSREVLYSHSITGKVSNAFKDIDAKPQLDSEKVKSLCEYGARRFGCKEADVRQVMMSRMSNIVKVEKAKQRGTESK